MSLRFYKPELPHSGIWGEGADVLNKESRIVEKGWYCDLGLRHHKKQQLVICYIGQWTPAHSLGQNRARWEALVNSATEPQVPQKSGTCWVAWQLLASQEPLYWEAKCRIVISEFDVSFLSAILSFFYKVRKNIVTCMCDCRRGLDWWIDLLTTCMHHSELQSITVPPLIYKF
jgi:hypothetical protein